MQETAALAMPEVPSVRGSSSADAEDLGVFGAMALLAVVQAGGAAGFRRYCARSSVTKRLAPHPALRHRIFTALLNAGVLAPVTTRERLDDAVSNADWSEANLDDTDWAIVWDDWIFRP